MRISSETVALARCRTYDRRSLRKGIAAVAAAAGIACGRGARVLLKPNLVSGRLHNGFACTNGEFIAAVAELFLDQGASVAVGDSPAFGTAKGVMAACGIDRALKKLPVQLVNFGAPRQVKLSSGLSVGIAGEALDCDVLVNLPKVKAHSQLLVTLAVKNFFGAVVGFRKPWLHARHGDIGNRFEALLVDLLAVLPESCTLADGVVAMHHEGPILGKPYPLGLIAGSANPVAVDTALLSVLNVAADRSILWRECRRRNMPGTEAAAIRYPLLQPQDVRAGDFIVPGRLKPVSFHPWRLISGSVKRLLARSS